MALVAGAAQVCITPPIGVELAGYGPFLGRRARSIHDDLYAAALVLGNEHIRVAVVTADVISLDAVVVDNIRRMAAQRTGISADHILLSCIHSHTSPSAQVLRAWGEVDPEYVSLLARQLTGAIVAANYARQPARIGYGTRSHPDLAWNRVMRQYKRDEVGTVDASVQVLRVDPVAGGGPLALLVNYGCHPVMLGTKTAISADYPGALRRHLTATFPDAVVLFANGTCGDIDPVHNRDAWGQATFDDVDQAGARLAAEAVRAAENLELQTQAPVQAATCTVDLPYRVLTPEEVEAELLKRTGGAQTALPGPPNVRQVNQQHFWQTWAREVLDALESGAAPTVGRAELQAIRVGDGVLVAIPAEVFTQTGLAIKAASPFTHTLIVSYANGNVGYIPTEEDFANQGYASNLAFAIYGYFPFQTDVSQRTADAAGALLQRLAS